MSIRDPERLKKALTDPKRLAREFSRHTYGMLAWVDLFGAKLKSIRDPEVKLVAAGAYDATADALRLRALKLERDGFVADAKGSVAKLATSQELDLDGTLAYDLAKLEPQLKAYLGRGAQAVGKDSRPFKLSGRLADGGKSVAVTVGRSSERGSRAEFRHASRACLPGPPASAHGSARVLGGWSSTHDARREARRCRHFA